MEPPAHVQGRAEDEVAPPEAARGHGRAHENNQPEEPPHPVHPDGPGLQSVQMLMGPTVVTAFDATVMLVMVLGKMMFYVDMRLTLVAVIPLLLIMYGDYYCGASGSWHSRRSVEAPS